MKKGESALVYQNKKPSRNHNKIFLVIAVLVFGAAIMINSSGHLFGFFYTRGQEAPEMLDGIPLYTDYLPEGSAARPGIKRKIMYVTIHETDNPSASADAKAHNEYLHQITESKKLSWHYTVDDSEIYHHIPDDEIAFNAGDGYKKDGGNIEALVLKCASTL